jgi:hypothetical protein
MSTQARIWPTVSAGGAAVRPRRSRRSWAREDPPGSPRRPERRAASSAFQLSPRASATGPDLTFGHSPVRVKWASAQARIYSAVRGGHFRDTSPSISRERGEVKPPTIENGREGPGRAHNEPSARRRYGEDRGRNGTTAVHRPQAAPGPLGRLHRGQRPHQLFFLRGPAGVPAWSGGAVPARRDVDRPSHRGAAPGAVGRAAAGGGRRLKR